ncbi:MAG: TonB-dependent receptor [Terriglobia bacterium]
MRFPKALRIVIPVVCLLLLPALGRAQVANASLRGTIFDQSGAVIPKASMRLKSLGEGAILTVSTGTDGGYVLPNLIPGIYELRVSAPGFREYVQSGIKLGIDETAHLDVKLELGTAAQTVEVSASASPLNAENAVQEGGLSPDTLEHLPLVLSTINRNIFSFLAVEPGVNTSGGDNRNGFDARVNGGMAEGDEAILDGICLEEGATSADGAFVSIADHPISPEAVSEFKEITSNYQPQYGTTTSGIMVAVTKSGTSKFNGSLYDFTRNTDFDARSWGTVNRPSDQINEFGGSIGGPLNFLPGLKKLTWTGRKKTYFFVNYEGFRSRGGATVQKLTLPTAQEREGNFSDWVDSSGNLIPIYDPNTTLANPNFNSANPVGPANLPYLRQQFMGCDGGSPNVICPQDPRLQSSLASSWIKFMPGLTFPNQILNNYIVPVPVSVTLARDDTLTDIRVDHYIGERDHVDVTVHYIGTFAGNRASLPPQIDTNTYREPNYGFLDRLNYDHTFRPNLINNLNLGYNDFPTYSKNTDDPYTSTMPQIPGVFAHLTPPVLQFDHYTQLGADGYFGERRPSYVANDTMSWVKGKHTVRFGGEWRASELNDTQDPNASGTFYFSDLNTGLLGLNTPSGNSFASFLLGEVATGSSTFTTAPSQYARQKYYALHVGDTWKIGRKLNLDYGVRWDLSTPTSDKYNRFSFFDPNGPDPGANNLPGRLAFAGSSYGSASYGKAYPESIWYKGFGPRLGLAYSVTPKTVARAGFALIFAKMFYPNYSGGIVGGQDGFNANPSFTSSNGGITPAFLLQNGLPGDFTHPPFINSSFDNGQTVAMFRDPEAGRLPYTQQWNISLQHQFTSNFYVDAAYVGNNAHRLLSLAAPVNVLNPSLLSKGQQLNDQFQPGEATLDGVSVPYPNWVSQMTGCAPTVAQALLPYPQYCGTLQQENEDAGNSTYNSFQGKAEKRFSHGFWFLGSYTNEKWIANTLDVQGWTPNGASVSPFQRSRDKHLTSQDVPQTIALSLVYELPFGGGKRFVNTGGIAGKVIGGWQVSTIFRASSGTPLPITSSLCDIPSQFSMGCLPAVLPGAKVYAQSGKFNPNEPYLNKAAFEGQSGFNFFPGNGSPVSNIRQPGFHNQDFTLEKTTRITERVNFKVNVQAFNLWNWHCYCQSNSWGTGGAYNTDLNNPNFGGLTGLVTSPRSFQLGGRFTF